VVARFADRSLVEADYLIACDGVGSVVRQQEVGDEKRYLGLNSIHFESTLDPDHPFLEGGYFLMLGRNGCSLFCYRQPRGVYWSYVVHAHSEAETSGEQGPALLDRPDGRGSARSWASGRRTSRGARPAGANDLRREMEERDVVVIGAGAAGLAVAVALRRRGQGRVLVIDRLEAAGMGSTSRANGGVRAQFGTRINIEFSRYTIEGLRALDERSGGRVGLRQVGYLFLAGTEAGESALRRNLELQAQLDVPARWLEAGEILAMAPYVEPRGLRGGTFCPTDGLIDPHGVVSALLDEGRSLGVEYRLGTEVVELDPAGDGLAVHTKRGTLRARTVVNAGGARAARIAAMAGVEVPVEPYRRNLACTEPVPGPPDPIPMCVDLDTGVLIRREAGGFLLAYSDPADAPSFDEEFDAAFLDRLAARIGHRFPFLEGVPINQRKCWAGLYPETPDHHAIIDVSPGLDALVQCVGFGGHGIMHSLAAGQAVAELVGDGACTSFDLRPLRLARFRENDLVVEPAVL
jgi:sarcosine oxidase, subunit beta